MRDKGQGRREEREGRKMSRRKIRGWRRGGKENERVVIATILTQSHSGWLRFFHIPLCPPNI